MSIPKSPLRRSRYLQFLAFCIAAACFLGQQIGRMQAGAHRGQETLNRAWSHKPVAMRAVVISGGERTASLYRLLRSLCLLISDGDRIDLDVWIDIPQPPDDLPEARALRERIAADIEQLGKNGTYHNGQVRAHVWSQHMGLAGQWLNAWHESLPEGLTEDTSEIGLILEDDLELSPYSWLWLKGAHKAYGKDPRVAGFALMRLSLCAARCPHPLGGPNGAGAAFFYPLLGTWGYAPTARSFSRFRAWRASLPPGFKPYVDGITPTDWYQNFERVGTEKKRMWSMFHIKYTDTHEDKYTVYVKCKGNYSLAVNHKEIGLNYPVKMPVTEYVLDEWGPEYLQFPTDPMILDYAAKVVSGQGVAGGVIE